MEKEKELNEEELDEEWDEERRMIVRAKWKMDGASTLSEAAEMLEDFAEYLRGLEKEGWQLENAVEDDYGFLEKP